MKFLLVVKQNRNVATFLETIGCLVEGGHEVALGIQERDDKRDAQLATAVSSDRFGVVRCPPDRLDEWASIAPLVRRLRDALHYLQGPMRDATKLQGRILTKLHRELRLPEHAESAFVEALRAAPEPQLARLESVTRLAERSLPTAALLDEFIAAQRPDVILISPLVHFGSAQADVVASARRLGIPAWMLLYSWDNLSTKGCLHRWPDRMFVWNEQQKEEAVTLHGYPRERVVVVGAPRFDHFFSLGPVLSREEFHGPLGLDPSRPTLLYVCSSPLVAERELGFIRRWVKAVRAAGSPALRDCNILVRPHPDIDLLPQDQRVERHQWPAAPHLGARVARPFDDPCALVLRTEPHMPQGLYESIAHSIAVVGLNTSAELEAGIVGRPVFTVLADAEEADGQSGTLHFHYLTKAQGGFVSTATSLEQHVGDLETLIHDGADPAPIRAFIETFLRPHGISRPVAPILADLLVRGATQPPAAAIEADAGLDGDEVEAPTLAVAPPPRGTPDIVPLRFKGCRILVHATGEAQRRMRKGRVKIDKDTAAWLTRSVAVADVVYDIGADFGPYTLLAAKYRGATVVAFEGAYAAYAALCDNLLLNGCEGSVVPVPLVVSSRDALGTVRYQNGSPGQGRYIVRSDDWRSRPGERDSQYIQPSCLSRLDTIVERYGLPSPNHIRIAPRLSPLSVIAGGAKTLTLPSLKTLEVQVPSRLETELLAKLAALGWAVTQRKDDEGDLKLVVARGSSVAAAVGVPAASPETDA